MSKEQKDINAIDQYLRSLSETAVANAQIANLILSFVVLLPGFLKVPEITCVCVPAFLYFLYQGLKR